MKNFSLTALCLTIFGGICATPPSRTASVDKKATSAGQSVFQPTNTVNNTNAISATQVLTMVTSVVAVGTGGNIEVGAITNTQTGGNISVTIGDQTGSVTSQEKGGGKAGTAEGSKFGDDKIDQGDTTTVNKEQ